MLDSGCLSLIEHKGYDIGAPCKIYSALAWKSVERLSNVQWMATDWECAEGWIDNPTWQRTRMLGRKVSPCLSKRIPPRWPLGFDDAESRAHAKGWSSAFCSAYPLDAATCTTKGDGMTPKLLIIPDAHAEPNYDNDRFTWLGNLIFEEKPTIML